MTYRQAEKVWDRYLDLLHEAARAVDHARDCNFRNGFWAPSPQIADARLKLAEAHEMLDQVKVALEVLS